MDDIYGLTPQEAEASARQYGGNAITAKAQKRFLHRYLASFGDPIIRILLVALGVNVVFMFRDAGWYETVGIALAVLLATLIATLSEYGSESAFSKLQAEAAHIKCRVKRAGAVTELPVDDIVTGDMVLLQAGERVPADGRLALGELTVDQSALNGETKEAYKYPVSGSAPADDFLSPDGLFRGSVVCAGEGVMRVEKVGDHTFYGCLAAEVQEDTIESPLKSRLAHLAKVISRFGYAAAAVVAAANLFTSLVAANHFDPALIAAHIADKPRLFLDGMKAVTLGITVIVMAVPEGLPMMITVVLSANMRRMLKDHVLVRKLVGIETSGSLNILFTDKTGTLTKGRLSVTSFITHSGRLLAAQQAKDLPLFARVRDNCRYNNGAQVSRRHLRPAAIGGNATDRALLSYVMEMPSGSGVRAVGYRLPFDSRAKLSVTELVGEKPVFLFKGAPENLLPRCTHAYDEDGRRVPFAYAGALKSAMAAQARDAVRLIALCEGGGPSPSHLTLVGLLGLRDEVRKEARPAIRDIADAGVQVVMVTGDNPDTAVSVAVKLGMMARGDTHRVLTSPALNRMSDDEVKKKLPHLRVIARALPSDKGRLVRLSQEMGLVAGMTGDGVNDAPALKKADVGFAMGDGTEIAKEAGDIVILDNNFASIVKAVLYGRTIFKSIRKFLIFQLTINLCAVGVSVLGPFIGVPNPVTVIQMLWINMIMDTLAGLAYAGETPLPEYLREPPKKRGEPIINKYMYHQILTTGLYTTALCLLFLKLPVIARLFGGEEPRLLTGFFALFIFAGVFNSLNARTYRLNLFSYISRNKAFIGIMAAVSAIQLLLIYYGGPLFRASGLRLRELAAVTLLAASVIAFDLTRKAALRVGKRKGFI